VVDVSSDNAFKGWLNKTRETRMGFFMDSPVGFLAGEATQGLLQGE